MDLKGSAVGEGTVFDLCKSLRVNFCLDIGSFLIYSPKVVLLLLGWWPQRGCFGRETSEKLLRYVSHGHRVHH